jgi:cell division septum initiation protein DivIVA
MEERRILSNVRHNSSDVTRINFSTIRKNGLDPQEVRTYLDTVSREMGQLEQRIRELQDQVAEAQYRAAHPTFDEATLTAALGAQSAAILRSAHEEAGRVTAEAQERATATFSEAQKRAATHLIETQERITALLTEAEQSAARIDLEARNGADRLIETAKINGDALVERGREQGRAIVDQANEARRTILNDLAVKRKALTIQIDQLRAARDTLNEFVGSIRDHVDGVLATIADSDEQARQAALEALRLRTPAPEPTEEELLANTPLRQVAEATLAPMPKSSSVTILPPEPSTAPTPVVAPSVTVSGSESFIDEESAGADVVNDIFARLRKATLEERGASSAPVKKAPPAPAMPETPVGELFARRDAALEESLSVLTRKVKRALQDDQNVTLERLRDEKGSLLDSLEDELSQRGRYADAAFDALVDATAAGREFAHDETGATGTVVDQNAIRECAADLAVTVVVALRKRIMADGNGEASDRANAAYKEWRGARIERLCTDAARRAFHIGVAAAAADGRSIRFLAAPNDAPCDACALDAAAPVRASGQPFPSSSLYPPLHAGCACTIIPA